MIGLPKDQTLVESGLKTIGLAGALLSAVFMLLIALLAFLSLARVTDLSIVNMFPLFFIGAMGVVSGLMIAALGQFLATFRFLAQNSSKKEF